MAKDHDSEKKGGGHGGHGGHSGGGSHEEHEGAPEWLISFADNVMLQMGFFVILLAINMGIKAKGPTEGEGPGTGGEPAPEMLDMAIAIRAGFKSPVDLNSTKPEDQPLIRRLLERKNGGGNSLQPEEPGQGREHQTIVPTERSSLGGLVPFDDDADALSARARSRAEEIGAKMAGHRWVIEVRGHASPSESARDARKGYELGFRRAHAVAEVLAAQGIPWAQLRVSSAGDGDRKIDRDYERDADRANQRVEVIITGEAAK